jgi:hypothetical protein
MARYDGIVHQKLPPGTSFPVRAKDTPIAAEDVEQISPEFIRAGLLRLQEALGTLARHIENRGNPVDEYNTTPITGAASESTLTVLPTYEMMNEKIVGIIVSGPPTTSITIQLGDRQWPVIIPATGILVIAPIALILGRNDDRKIIAQTPGNYFLELMGYADSRFKS